MRHRVVITGIGAVAGNAAAASELAEACLSGKSGLRKCTAFDTSGLLTEYFGEIPGLPQENRLETIIRTAAGEMLVDCGMTAAELSEAGPDCRLFYGTLLSNTDSYYRHSLNKQSGRPADDTLANMNDYAACAKDALGIQGTMHISSAACASGTTAIGMAFDFIRSGICRLAVAGGADPLTKIAAYGFHSLKALSRGICNPYDEARDGINIGECGAFFMMETLERAKARGAKIYCEVAGYGLGNDACHITSPDPTGAGAYSVMRMALDDAALSASNLDYINGHGTGTRANDSMEMKAVHKLLADCGKTAAVSSTKALLGHCMGASGAIELASVILAMERGEYLPMPRLKRPILEAEGIFLSDKTADLSIGCALSNSFAFAGNDASVLIRRYEEAGA